MATKLLTLVMLIKDNRILLGMKKRGFGANRWNGFGGKLHEGESLEAAAKRETQEEAGVVVEDLEPRGILRFGFEGQEEQLEVHVFVANNWQGEPTESEEMRPQWFNFDEIPYHSMWLDDPFWLPHVLAGKSVQGTFQFQDQTHLLSHEVQVK